MDVTSATVHGVQSGSVFKIICSGNRRNGKRKRRKCLQSNVLKYLTEFLVQDCVFLLCRSQVHILVWN